MLWVLVGAAPLLALVVRLIALQRKPEIWWLSFTIALAGIIAGSMFLVDERGLNQFLGVPNVAYLLSCLSFLVAGGAVTVYVHTLRRTKPSTRVLAMLTGLVLVEGLTLVLLWRVAAVHEREFGRFRTVPLTPSLVGFEWLFHASFVPILINVAICAFVLAQRTPSGDPARRIGLLILAFANGLDVFAHLLYLGRASAQPVIGDRALAAAAAADLLTVVAVAGIGIGTTALLVVPQLLHSRRALHLARTLRPLWRRALELYPEVGMQGAWRIRARQSLQTERMLIEIADALRLLPVRPTSPTDDPYTAVAEAFRRPRADTERLPTALAMLPAPTSRLEEEEQVLRLARRYKEYEHAS